MSKKLFSHPLYPLESELKILEIILLVLAIWIMVCIINFVTYLLINMDKNIRKRRVKRVEKDECKEEGTK